MANLSVLQADISAKLGITSRSVNRRIKEKEDVTLHSREVAALMVALDSGLSIKKYATKEEIAEVRAAVNGSSSAAPTDPPSVSPTSTPAAARATRRPTDSAATQRRRRGKTVFVVHGRNEPLRRAMFDFLRAVGLSPMEWSSALKAAGSGTATIMQVIEVMVKKSAGVVVLLTPDDLVKLKPELQKKNEKRVEKELAGQARPNVLFEAGIVMGSMPRDTVLVQIGDVKEFTDVGGIHVMHLDNSAESRNTFVQKLEAANCAVNNSGTDWLTAGDFEQETYDG